MRSWPEWTRDRRCIDHTTLFLLLGLITETSLQSNNQTMLLMYCWSPNDAVLLTDHKFMITRQVLRLIVYYLMPLVFVSIFYILIAKHLFQAKSVIFTPSSAQPFLNNVPPNKQRQQRYSSGDSQMTRETSSKICSFKMLPHQNSPQKHRASDVNSDNYRRNRPVRSMTLTDERLMNTENSVASLPSTTMRPSKSLTNNARRSKDLVYENSITNKKSHLAMHTLYQNAKTRKQLRARRKVAKTVLFLCIVFFICWLPKQIHDLYW